MNAEAPINYFDTSPEAQSARASRRLGKRGSRRKLADRALNDLCQVWDEQGVEAVRRMAFHDPSGFVKTVAALLPQKIEHTFPTDGLSDDRLSDLLAIADDMAKRLGVIDENRLIDVTPEEGGGGPERVGDAAGRAVSPLPASAAATEQPNRHNGLETPVVPDSQSGEAATLPYPVGKPCPSSAADEERRNKAKLNDDVDPASLF